MPLGLSVGLSVSKDLWGLNNDEVRLVSFFHLFCFFASKQSIYAHLSVLDTFLQLQPFSTLCLNPVFG
ncbi:hypothetical protein PMIT1327_00434 [Prochlorococcus marinus str. MIT 1327]|nr:hypothetical protein PMIT1312_00875 [Prochlorococcus marinus str. MIT 1312]KZR83353.1 hypothetical protein PMIT1327_00434 [Prochlorococcus marinus str. MIT 1327]